jgi:hypothetical protein
VNLVIGIDDIPTYFQEKVNNNLSKGIFDMTNSLPNLFKCAVHPLLQFREVCEKELIRIENVS